MNDNTSKTGEIISAIIVIGLILFMMYLANEAIKIHNIKAASFYTATSFGTFLGLIISLFRGHIEVIESDENDENDENDDEIPITEMKTIETFNPNKYYKAPKTTTNTKGYIYLLSALHDVTIYKIGRTKNPRDRLKTFNVKLPFDVDFICTIKTDDMYKLEHELHSKYKDKRVNGEWFKLDSEDVDYIKGLANA